MSRFRYTGLSLIELMLALSISSIILLASIHLLQHTIKIYHYQQRHIQALEKIRYRGFIFSHSIHMAGFLGCHTMQHTDMHSNLKDLRLLNPYMQNSRNFPTAIIAYAVDNRLHLPTFIRQHAKPYSDVLIVSYLNSHTTTLQKTMKNRSAPLLVSRKLMLKKGNIVVINDCKGADAFAVSRLQGSKPTLISHAVSSKNKTEQLSHIYHAGAQVGKFIWQMFYLRQTHKDPVSYGLFLQTQTGRSEEVSDHIDNLRVYFTTHANSQHYLPSRLLKDFSKVTKLKIVLTLREPAMQTKTTTFYLSLRN